jgi:hypothetical protein
MSKTKVKRLKNAFRKTKKNKRNKRNKRTLNRKYNKRGGVTTRSAARRAPYSSAPAPPVPVAAFSSVPIPLAEEPDSCPVCLEQEPLCDIVPCNHKLCKSCYEQLPMPKTCPLCRGPIEHLNCHDLYNKIIQVLQGNNPLYEGHRLNELLKYFYVNRAFNRNALRRYFLDGHDYYESGGISLAAWNNETGKNWVVPLPPNAHITWDKTIPPIEPNNYVADLEEINALLADGTIIVEKLRNGLGPFVGVRFVPK